jgi:enoyl-CoA hydratase
VSVPDVALLEIVDRVATVTLNRPDARNALSTELIRALSERVGEADARDDVDVLILTGADPAFCAGLDLKELGLDGGPLKGAPGADGDGDATDNQGDRAAAPPRRGRGPTLPTSKPIIGAVNGVAVTGGLELALQCDFLVASERARFADTHARVGVHPLWGLTVLLPQAVGMRRAREMSATGNFIDAPTALEWGLVNHVVAHEELLPTARRLAADIVTSDQRALRAILATYEEASRVPGGEAWDVEARCASVFQRGGVDPDEIERRRRGVVDRGRSQV